MTKTWQPSYVNMGSRDDCDTVRRRHAEHLAYFNATEADCQLVDLKPSPTWDGFLRCHFRLNINSYLGWKVSMLHTGCFASLSEWEDEACK